MFFTTKKHGTGLGLSISRRMVEDITAPSKFKAIPDAGPKFSIVLPAA